MRCLFLFFLGAGCAGVIFGSWWLTIGAGLLALLVRRSYVVLAVGVMLDIWFAVNGGFIGAYTLTFVSASIVFEYIRSQLFFATWNNMQ